MHDLNDGLVRKGPGDRIEGAQGEVDHGRESHHKQAQQHPEVTQELKSDVIHASVAVEWTLTNDL